MKVIIAEKPSLARNIANALGADKKCKGYLEGNGYYVTWAFGHIYQLKDVEDYEGEKKKWSELQLPYYPEFQYKLPDDKGKKEQIEIIKNLMSKDDVTSVVNAGDADREGQIIIDNILNELKCKKPTERLWLPEQTEESIRLQINNMENNDKYANLRNEGYARTFVDWLYGINLTIHISVKTGEFYSVGRVQVPIVEAIYNRDMQIKHFKPEDYYVLESNSKVNNEDIKLVTKNKYKKDELEQAKSYAKDLNSYDAVVEELEEKEIKKTPPKLFSLSTLQSQISKKHKINFADSLKIIQKLYEAGYITYPRTNTEYLAEAEKDKVKQVINKLQTVNNIDLEFVDSKRIFDDSKIESHSAIIPTLKIPKELSGNEKIIYETVLFRFISNFLAEPYIINRTTIKIKVKDEEFELKGDVVVSQGFSKYEDQKVENKLPKLDKGNKFNVEFIPVAKKTQPPKKMTEEALSNYLKNPFRKEIEEVDSENGNDDEEYKAMLKGTEIGTEATRTSIIEKVKNCGYISQKGSVYSIEEKGINLMTNLNILKVDMHKEKTVKIQELLKDVYREERTIDDVLNIAKDEITEIVSQNVVFQKKEKEIIGSCPICGRKVYEFPKSYTCQGYEEEPKCNFILWKNSKWWTLKGKKFTKNIAKELLEKGQVHVKGFKSKKGSKYNATVRLNLENENYINFEMSFEK